MRSCEIFNEKFYKKMKTEIERARASIKEYREGYGQSQLSTDCIIQLMIGHAKSEQLRINGVSQQRELLLSFLLWRDETWGLREDIEGNKEQVEEYLKANNCG